MYSKFIQHLFFVRKHIIYVAFTPTASVESPITQMCMSLDCGRMLEYTEGEERPPPTRRFKTTFPLAMRQQCQPLHHSTTESTLTERKANWRKEVVNKEEKCRQCKPVLMVRDVKHCLILNRQNWKTHEYCDSHINLIMTVGKVTELGDILK